MSRIGKKPVAIPGGVTADIADGGETAEQLLLSSLPGNEVEIANLRCHGSSQRDAFHEHVGMRVDQPWHQRATGSVDDHRPDSILDPNRRQRNTDDLVASYQDMGRRRKRGSLTIKDSHIFEQYGRCSSDVGFHSISLCD